MIAAPLTITPHTSPHPVLPQVPVTHRKLGLRSGSALATLPLPNTPRLELPVLSSEGFFPTTTRHSNA